MTTASLSHVAVPIARGDIYWHYQSDHRAKGRKATRATPSESGQTWALFTHTTVEAVEAWLEANGWVRADVYGSHDCTGEFFARTPWIRQTGFRILVTQSWGHDV